MDLKKLQEKLDFRKYHESEIIGKDLCGTYFYCKYCNKKNKYPCASAYKKYSKELGRKVEMD